MNKKSRIRTQLESGTRDQRGALLRRRARAGGAGLRARAARRVLLHFLFVHLFLCGGAVRRGGALSGTAGRVLRLFRCIGSSHQERNRRNGQEGGRK